MSITKNIRMYICVNDTVANYRMMKRKHNELRWYIRDYTNEINADWAILVHGSQSAKQNGKSMITASTGFAEGRAWVEIGKNRWISMEVGSHIVDRRVRIKSMYIRRRLP
jgi:hypothetical protein